YIVGLEYHNNRASVLNQQRAIYSKLESKVEDLKKSLSEQFLQDQHSSVEIESVQSIVDKFDKELTAYLK
uniref:PIN-like domain-containing protein n=1 Tax=Vibrio campbellii TaxID=680 RepID=UPI000AD31266